MFGNTAQSGGGYYNRMGAAENFGYDAFGKRINKTTPLMVGAEGYNREDFVNYLRNKYPDMDLQALAQMADTRESALNAEQNQSVLRVGPTPKPFEFKKTPVHTGLKTNQYGTNTIFS